MINKVKTLSIPKAARVKMILPSMRDKIFKEIISVYKNKYGLTPVYGFLNTDTELITDYAVVFKIRNSMDTLDLILYMLPPIYSDFSTPAYRYCRANKMGAKWFKTALDQMVVMPKHNFYGFITQTLKLSLDKTHPAYWKRPENYFVVLTGLSDLANIYNKPRYDRPKPSDLSN